MKTGITIALAAAGALGGSRMLGVAIPFISAGYSPPAECVQWYNGCNMCQKEPDGSVSCTSRLCASPGRGFCLQEATSTAQS